MITTKVRLWRYLKSKRQNTCGVSTLISNGKSFSEPRDKAEALNKQFSSVFTSDKLKDPPDLGASPYAPMPQIQVSENGVASLLRKLNPRKACGADNIPAIFLQTCASEIAPMLTFIMQQSLDSKTVPSDWKTALVSPVFKKGDRSNPENYRPISLTSICWKLTEHIIASETMRHIDHQNILT